MRTSRLLSGILPQILVFLGVHPAAGPAAAQTLQWTGTQKLEQIIGDIDWQTGAPTASQTYIRSYVLANGLGYSFEHFNRSLGRNELIFLFGDTVSFGTYSSNNGLDCYAFPVGAAVSVTTACSSPPTAPTDFLCPLGPPPFITIGPCLISAFNYRGQDPIARSDTTDGDSPLVLQFFMQDQLPLFVTPSPLTTNGGDVQIATGGDDIPNSGISVKNKIYIVYNTGSTPSCGNSCAHANGFSVLVRFHQKSRTFETLRKLSAVNAGGHFLFTSMHLGGGGAGGLGGPRYVYMFGTGDYRLSDIYLARIPEDNFESGIGTQYVKGFHANGQPEWTRPAADAQDALNRQTRATPVIVDDAPSPSIGNISAAYVPALRLWLMTYNADGTNPPVTRSVFLRYASTPWGKWSDPLPIYNACTNGGFGNYIHYVGDKKDAGCRAADPGPSGPGGPMVGQDNGSNDPETQRGGAFAPSMIEPFTKVQNGTLSIYYTLSTWNPYTVVKMRSDFRITQ